MPFGREKCPQNYFRKDIYQYGKYYLNIHTVHYPQHRSIEVNGTHPLLINLYLFGCDVTPTIINCRDLHFLRPQSVKTQFQSLGSNLTRGDKTMMSRYSMRQKSSINYWIFIRTGGREQATENVELFSEKIDLGLQA